MKNKVKIFLIFVILLLIGFVFYRERVFIKNSFFDKNKKEIPKEQSFEDIKQIMPGAPQESGEANTSTDKKDEPLKTDPTKAPTSSLPSLPQEFNLKVPFIIQSPDQTWKDPYKEGCEEASILMVYGFLKDKNLSVNFAMSEISNMVNWEIKNYGGHFDISASTTANLAENFYGLKSEIFEIKSSEDIKNKLISGYPIIVPCAGRELKNPNFKNPGPIYHMLVVKGYTKDGKIITNDPGTRKGKDYLYDPKIFFDAIADWSYEKMSPNSSKKLGIILK